MNLKESNQGIGYVHFQIFELWILWAKNIYNFLIWSVSSSVISLSSQTSLSSTCMLELVTEHVGGYLTNVHTFCILIINSLFLSIQLFICFNFSWFAKEFATFTIRKGPARSSARSTLLTDPMIVFRQEYSMRPPQRRRCQGRLRTSSYFNTTRCSQLSNLQSCCRHSTDALEQGCNSTQVSFALQKRTSYKSDHPIIYSKSWYTQ